PGCFLIRRMKFLIFSEAQPLCLHLHGSYRASNAQPRCSRDPGEELPLCSLKLLLLPDLRIWLPYLLELFCVCLSCNEYFFLFVQIYLFAHFCNRKMVCPASGPVLKSKSATLKFGKKPLPKV